MDRAGRGPCPIRELARATFRRGGKENQSAAIWGRLRDGGGEDQNIEK